LRFDKFNRQEVYKELEDGVWYFNAVDPNLNRVSFKNQLEDLKEAESIIVDLRGSVVNNMREILSHFTNEKQLFNLNNQINTVYPDHTDDNVTYTKQQPYTILPKEPYLDQEIIFLTNHGTSYMAEGILHIMKQNQRGVVVGQPTRGELGTSSIFIQLPNYLNVRMTMSITEMHEPTLNEAFPVIQPDFKVEPSLKAIKHGRDEYIERALKVIKQDK